MRCYIPFRRGFRFASHLPAASVTRGRDVHSSNGWKSTYPKSTSFWIRKHVVLFNIAFVFFIWQLDERCFLDLFLNFLRKTSSYLKHIIFWKLNHTVHTNAPLFIYLMRDSRYISNFPHGTNTNPKFKDVLFTVPSTYLPQINVILNRCSLLIAFFLMATFFLDLIQTFLSWSNFDNI